MTTSYLVQRHAPLSAGGFRVWIGADTTRRLVADHGIDVYRVDQAMRAADAGQEVTLTPADGYALTITTEPPAEAVADAEPLPVDCPDARTPIGTPVLETREGAVGRIEGASSAALMVRLDRDGQVYGIHPAELLILTPEQYVARRLSAARAASAGDSSGE